MVHGLRQLPKHPLALPMNAGWMNGRGPGCRPKRSAVRAPDRLHGVLSPQHHGSAPWSARAYAARDPRSFHPPRRPPRPWSRRPVTVVAVATGFWRCGQSVPDPGSLCPSGRDCLGLFLLQGPGHCAIATSSWSSSHNAPARARGSRANHQPPEAFACLLSAPGLCPRRITSMSHLRYAHRRCRGWPSAC
jgi:hypothetical protein